MRIFSAMTIDRTDLLALVWFAIVWIGYFRYAAWRARREPTLYSRMCHWRLIWMQRAVKRDNRMGDVAIVTSLSGSAQFFASTAMLVLGALVALMGYTEKAVDLVAELPFTRRASQQLWEIKTLLLLLIFVYAFLKFSWSIRQFGFAAVMIGAAPDPKDVSPQDEMHATWTAQLLDLAGGNYNNGLRAYYFGLAALAWFLHPTLFVVATTVVFGILYQREFKSDTLKTLKGG